MFRSIALVVAVAGLLGAGAIALLIAQSPGLWRLAVGVGGDSWDLLVLGTVLLAVSRGLDRHAFPGGR